MPVLTDPRSQKFPIVLEADKGKDPEPTFFARALSMSEFDSKRQAMADSKSADDVLSMLKSLICDWRDVTDEPFVADKLPDILQRSEALELIHLAFAGNMLSETERKKAESHRSCGAVSCAVAVGDHVSTN